MKISKRTYILLLCLVALTALAAALYLTTRPKVGKGAILVDTGSKGITVALSELPSQPISGQTINGKGEVKEVRGEGIYLREVLSAAGLNGGVGAYVTSDDGYRAEVAPDELWDTDRAVLMLQEDGGVRLYVFGDENSKRNVSNVVHVAVAEEE